MPAELIEGTRDDMVKAVTDAGYDYIKSIELGIRKINCYTYMAKAGGTAVANLKNEMLYHDIELEAIRAMLEDASKSIGFFSMQK